MINFCTSCREHSSIAQTERTESLTLSDLVSIFRSLRTRGEERPRSSMCRNKPSLARWLVRVLRNTCLSLMTGSIRYTPLLVAERFVNCTSPGSLDDVRLLMQVFDDAFTPDFMILAFPSSTRPVIHNEPLSTSKTTPALRKGLPPPNLFSNWPTKVSEDRKRECASAYRTATMWTCSDVCAVCGREPKGLTNPYIIERLGSSDILCLVIRFSTT